MSLLRRSPSAAAYVPDAEQFLTTNDRTRSSITSTIMPCLGWLSSPAACAATSGTAPFDVAELLRAKATVYL
ncbi:MAG: type IV secretion system protein VirD4, partial [Actinobacteria bacterium]|nr:type IV secretion system protein VirD4 [Actinomycetota bacterium]